MAMTFLGVELRFTHSIITLIDAASGSTTLLDTEVGRELR